MEGPTHDLNALCQQLGLPSETEALQAFISQHSPLAEAIELAEYARPAGADAAG